MASGCNKQYLLLAGRPILAHSVSLFENHPLIDWIFIISPREEIAFCRTEIVLKNRFAKVREIIPGGVERQDSVRNGLMGCGAAEDDLVLIHDGVRPLLPPHLIEPLLGRASEKGASVVGVPVKDTIKEVDANLRVTGTPDRDRYWQAQTPQVFRYGLIREAHDRAFREGFRGTDDASLVERMGMPVEMIRGSYRNIKITTPEDLTVARAFWEEDRG